MNNRVSEFFKEVSKNDKLRKELSEEEKGFESTIIDIKKIAKHKIICQKCGAEIYRQKQSELIKHPWKYCCARCGGTLKKEY